MLTDAISNIRIYDDGGDTEKLTIPAETCPP
jgi:hypothetical protein